MIDERGQRYAYLADDLRPKVQRVTRFAPLSEWQIRPYRPFTHLLSSADMRYSAHAYRVSDIVAHDVLLTKHSQRRGGVLTPVQGKLSDVSLRPLTCPAEARYPSGSGMNSVSFGTDAKRP